MAARFGIGCDRGVNHVGFTGRVERRTVPHGAYRITAGIPAQLGPGRWSS